jgi:oligopeptide transport system ATP-binding protein
VEPLLDIRDLRTQFFTQGGVVKAVDGVSLQLRPGETLGIVGESGCGKSVTALSTLRLIPEPGRIVGGEVRYKGRNILEMDEDEVREIRGGAISMIFQDPMTSLNPVLRIGDQIEEAMTAHRKFTREQARARTVQLLKQVGIPAPEARARDYPHQFSGGMRQRAMIAMALANEPSILIADEPTTALDVTIQAQILAILRMLNREFGTAIILITHNLGVVAGLCQRVLVMYAGHVVEEAPVNELFANPQHPYTWGLLKSMPRLDADRRETLLSIEGMPPDLINPPSGCLFYPRCEFREARNLAERPILKPVNGNPEHRVACWVTMKEALKVGQR